MSFCKQRQRKEFDKLTAQLAEQAEKDMLPKLEVEQTYQRLDMKTKQLNELADAMKTYSPSEEIVKKYAEEARLAALEAQKFRDEVLRKIEEEMARRKKLEKEKEEEKKKKLAEHYGYVSAYLCGESPNSVLVHMIFSMIIYIEISLEESRVVFVHLWPFIKGVLLLMFNWKLVGMKR